MSGDRALRVFVPSSAGLLTDHVGDGEGLIAFDILSRLAGRGHQLVVCARAVALAQEPPFEVLPIALERFESLRPLGYAWRARRAWARAAAHEPFDLVHWMFPQGRDVLSLLPSDLPLIIGPHSLEWPQPPKSRHLGDAIVAMLSPLEGTVRRRTMTAAHSVLVSVPDARHTYHGIVPDDALHVVPFGVDDAAFEVSALPSEPTVAFVGRLTAEKGITTLLDAFDLLAQTLPAACLRIAGDGPLRRLAEHRAAAAPGKVEVLGSVPHEQIPALLAGSSLLCLPSIGEPFGMATLEAMAAGRAIVGVDAGGTRALVDETNGGRLVPPDDAPALARALASLLSDRALLSALGQHNRARVERHYTWDRVIDQIEGLYYAAIAARAAGSTSRQNRC